jgi:hypothetical protein
MTLLLYRSIWNDYISERNYGVFFYLRAIIWYLKYQYRRLQLIDIFAVRTILQGIDKNKSSISLFLVQLIWKTCTIYWFTSQKIKIPICPCTCWYCFIDNKFYDQKRLEVKKRKSFRLLKCHVSVFYLIHK